MIKKFLQYKYIKIKKIKLTNSSFSNPIQVANCFIHFPFLQKITYYYWSYTNNSHSLYDPLKFELFQKFSYHTDIYFYHR